MSTRSSSPPANRWLIALFCLVLLLGAGLRLQRYLLRAPFWRDEAFIVVNVRDLPARQMLGPLRYDQAAPPGFLLLEHAMGRVFGTGEYSMRAIPLFCGLAAMGIVAGLAWRLFGITAAIFAGGLMAFCQRLIEFSAEVKQYSGDACAAAILLAVAMLGGGTPLRRLWRTAIVAAILVWFSHPTSIVFGGISAVLSIGAVWKDKTAGDARRHNETAVAIAGVVAANAIFALSFLLLYHFSIRLEHTTFLYSFWDDSFPDFSHPASLLPWLGRQTSQWLNESYHGTGWILAALAVLAARRWSRLWLMVAAAMALTISAACVRQYPYGGSRLTLFTLPGFFLLAGMGGEVVRRAMPAKWRPLWWVLPGGLLGYGLAWGILRAAEPHYHSYLRPAIAYLEQRRKPNEPIYCLGEPEPNAPRKLFAGRHVEILCYWPTVPGKVDTVVRSFDEIREDRFWVLVPFNSQDGTPALNKALKLFDPIAAPAEKFVDPRGGVAVLYQRRRRSSPSAPTVSSDIDAGSGTYSRVAEVGPKESR